MIGVLVHGVEIRVDNWAEVDRLIEKYGRPVELVPPHPEAECPCTRCECVCHEVGQHE